MSIGEGVGSCIYGGEERCIKQDQTGVFFYQSNEVRKCSTRWDCQEVVWLWICCRG